MRLLLTAYMLVSAGYVWSKTIEVKTIQDKVDVYVKNSDTNKLVKIGTTPLKMNYSEIVDNYSRSDNFKMVLKKDNFIDYRVLVSKLNSGKFEMNVNLESFSAKNFAKKYDKLISKLFDVQRLVRSRNYTEALKKLDKMEEKYPEIASVYEMKAMTYYMSKDLNKSLSAYRKAASVDPENKEVYTMKKYLEKELNAVPRGGK